MGIEFVCPGCGQKAIRRATGQYFCDECRNDGYICLKSKTKEAFEAAGFVLAPLQEHPSDATQ